MVTYRHKIWLRNLTGLFSEKQVENLKLLGLFIVLLCIILFFGMKNIEAISSGIEKQQQTEKIIADVKALEEENTKLAYQKELYNSDVELEAQYRALTNTKKPGESIYIISKGREQPSPTPTPENASEVKNKNNTPIIEKWLLKIF